MIHTVGFCRSTTQYNYDLHSGFLYVHLLHNNAIMLLNFCIILSCFGPLSQNIDLIGTMYHLIYLHTLYDIVYNAESIFILNIKY